MSCPYASPATERGFRIPGGAMCLPLLHDWGLVEVIGDVWSYRCRKCPATKTRVKKQRR